MSNNIKKTAELFDLGRVVADRRTRTRLRSIGIDIGHLIQQHVTGDWGHLPWVQETVNYAAVQCGHKVVTTFNLVDYSTGKPFVVQILTDDKRIRTVISTKGELLKCKSG